MANKQVPAQILLSSGSEGVVEFSAESDETKLPAFKMNAYTGAAMMVGYWDAPLVVDLKGLEIGSKARPILKAHNHSLIVGHTEEIATDGKKLIASGVVSGVGEAAKDVVGAAKNKFPWQASIGATVKKVKFIEEGVSYEANGRTFKGPLYAIQKSKLNEISFVALGADDNTSATVAAGFAAGETIECEETQMENGLKPPVTASQPEPTVMPVNELAAERKRIVDIQAACAGEYIDVEREAISAGWSLDQTNAKLLAAVRAARPKADFSVKVSANRGDDFEVKTLEAAVSLRAGLDENKLAAEMGDAVVSAAYRDRGISLQQLAIDCARVEGKNLPRTFGNDTIKASFSTVSLPGILNNVANKRLQAAYQAQPSVALRLCAAGDIQDFKESERYRMTDVGDLQPVAPDGKIKHGTVTEEKATNQLSTYGKIFTLTRQMMINDDLGAFLRIPAGMGARAARKIDQLFHTRLLANPTQSDGTVLFHADHDNYADGAATALSADSMATALQLFLDQTDSDGQPINVAARYLVVPTALAFKARELVKSQSFMAVGATDADRIPTYNPILDAGLTIVESPYLANASYSGSSALAWYLFADPAAIETFEIGYLRGQRMPTVEQGSVDFDELGISFRVYFDLGVREQDWRGMVKYKGEA